MFDVDGYILAGGASSRMGRDKAHLLLGGQTFVERAAASLAKVVGRVRLVSSKADAGASGLPVVADIYERCGALGGLHAALSDATAEWVLVVSCDLPFVTGELLTFLASMRSDEANDSEPFDAVVPVQDDGRWQPLCALYARARCFPVADELLASGERRPRVLVAQVRTRFVSFDELRSLRGAAHFFTNVNTPQDYEQAVAALRDL